MWKVTFEYIEDDKVTYNTNSTDEDLTVALEKNLAYLEDETGIQIGRYEETQQRVLQAV